MARSGRPGYGSTSTSAGRWRKARKWFWVSVPIWSLGVLSWAPSFARALSTKRPRDWAVTAGFFTVTAITLALTAASGPSTKQASQDDSLSVAAGSLYVLLMAAGAVHTAVVTARRPPIELTRADTSNAAAIAAAQSAGIRRIEARQIVQRDPALARDLKIGRPDLQRAYDDGGLVDVNHVPADVLVTCLEWTQAEAKAVVDARDGMGGFSNAAELGVYTPINQDRLDTVVDLLLFRRN